MLESKDISDALKVQQDPEMAKYLNKGSHNISFFIILNIEETVVLSIKVQKYNLYDYWKQERNFVLTHKAVCNFSGKSKRLYDIEN